MELSSHKSLAKELRSRNTELETENTRLHAQIGELRHRAELAEALQDPNANVDALRKHNAKLRQEVARLQKAAHAHSELESASNGKVAQLQARIHELERELKDLKEEVKSHDGEVERLEASLRKTCVLWHFVFFSLRILSSPRELGER